MEFGNAKELDWRPEFDSSWTGLKTPIIKQHNMIRSLLKFTVVVLLGIAVTETPVVLHAQDTNAATATNKPPANPSARPLPFRGTVKAIDSTAMTITVATRTFQITSQTTITKDGKPALLSDAAVGDNVTGSVKRGKDGKFTAVKLNFGLPAPIKSGGSNTKTNTP
jgi:hypothetical protein